MLGKVFDVISQDDDLYDPEIAPVTTERQIWVPEARLLFSVSRSGGVAVCGDYSVFPPRSKEGRIYLRRREEVTVPLKMIRAARRLLSCAQRAKALRVKALGKAREMEEKSIEHFDAVATTTLTSLFP